MQIKINYMDLDDSSKVIDFKEDIDIDQIKIFKTRLTGNVWCIDLNNNLEFYLNYEDLVLLKNKLDYPNINFSNITIELRLGLLYKLSKESKIDKSKLKEFNELCIFDLNDDSFQIKTQELFFSKSIDNIKIKSSTKKCKLSVDKTRVYKSVCDFELTLNDSKEINTFIKKFIL